MRFVGKQKYNQPVDSTEKDMNETMSAIMPIQKTNINDISRDGRMKLAEETYRGESYFQTLFHCDETIISCTEHADNFRKEIIRILLEKNIIDQDLPLETLHDQLTDDIKAYDFAHGVNKLSTFFYETDQQFTSTYHHFLKFIREEVIKEPFWFQSTPTIRLHCPNSINGDLYPRYHSDIFYGHPPEEINIWLPLTKKLTGHGFSMMTTQKSRELLKKYNYDYPDFIKDATYDREFSKYCESLAHPVDAEFGEMIVFDSRCIHSGEPLKMHTRVSMDIRVLPLSQYEQINLQHQGTGRLKILFEPGHCYDSIDSDQLN
jgi:hypothetical protein